MTDLVLLGRLDGTAAAIDADSIRALAGYTQRLADNGVTFSLGCGCHGWVSCGYHQEQSERVRAATA